MRINRQDTNGVKPLLQVGELGYDNWSGGGDKGRVYVGDGTVNIALAKKSEVDAKVVANVDITAGTATKVTYDAKGLVTSGTTLSAGDIPVLDAGKITTGTLPVVRGGTGTTTSTGTGSVVLSTSPVLVTPTIGAATGTSFNSITGLSSTTPVMDGTATAGTGVTVARADHVHPKDTTKVDANANITAGTYKSVTVDVKGLVTGGTNPTTISGYGITDAYTKAELNAGQLDNRYYTETEIDTLYSTAVKLTGNQTIAGIKTFSSSPIVPTPTTDLQVANKKYVDTRVGQLSTDYYQGSYGISWDYATDTYIRTGAKGYTSIQSLMRRCVVKADGTVNYYLNPDNSNFKEDGTPSILTGADGNVMVEIPKHYIKVETVGNVDSLSVSLTPEAGYVLDPAFLKWNGTAMVEVPCRYFRAYEGFVSGGKLLSVSGVTPTRTQTIATFRTQAIANGAGWHLTDWNLLNTIKRLCYIEFCDFIVTKYLGNGNDTGSDLGITTGQSNALGNRSSNSTHNDKYMSYRGIENMYADIWEFVDGVNVNNYQFYVNGKYSTFQSDVFTGDYVAKGPLTAAGVSNSLIKRCTVSVDGGFIPTVVGGSTTTFYGDASWSVTGARVALYGGSVNNGASGGLGSLGVDCASSVFGGDIGAAVCR